jgi:hypothetical protein
LESAQIQETSDAPRGQAEGRSARRDPIHEAGRHRPVEEIVVRIMRPQIAARSIFRKLGFQETVLPDYVKDLDGHKQDPILMRCDLQALSSELDDVISTWDWQRTH